MSGHSFENGEPDLQAALATIEDSRRTHVEWRDHWLRMRSEGHEDCETCTQHAAVAGGLARHESCIAAYDNVLAVLRHSRVPSTSEGEAPSRDGLSATGGGGS